MVEYITENGVNHHLTLGIPKKKGVSAMHSCLLIVVYLIEKKVVEKWRRMYKLGEEERNATKKKKKEWRGFENQITC